ncbi:MAG: DUF6719 family protein [Casimicrobiaceae bacterium]
MRTTAFAMAAGLLALMPGVGYAVDYLKEVPPAGALRYLQIVYVDDGTCPAGEVKEVTGGDRSKGVARKVRCVKRPD